MTTVKVFSNKTGAISSTFSLEDIAKVQKHRPEALKLYSGKGDARKFVFGISLAKTPSMSSSGICFANEDMSGKATFTIEIPQEMKKEDIKSYVAEKIGLSVVHLNEIEDQMVEALKDIAKEIKMINESIEMPDAE